MKIWSIILGLVLLLGTPALTPADQLPISGGITDPNVVLPVPAFSRPPAGTPYTEPVFRTRMRRVSNLSEKGGLEVPTYSQLQAFNADSTLMLLTSSEGYRIRRVSDFSEVQVFQGFNRQVPRWHPTRSTILVHFDEDWDADVTLQETDVLTNQTTDLHTFPDYKAIDSNRSFDELSRDGRWLAGYAIRNDNRREIFTFDLANHKVGLRLPLDQLCAPDPQWGLLEPDWLAPSPLGRYLVIQWVSNGTQRCSGLETYDLQTGAFVGRIVPNHPHGDLGITADGQEFFMTGSSHPDNPNMTGLAYYLLPGTATQADPHYVQLLDWKALASHISCQGPPGVCLISSTSWPEATCCKSGWQPFQQEIFLQYISGGDQPNYGPVVRLAHHRSSEQGYWAQPHATLSQDGHYALFGSDWGIDVGQEHVDPYLIELVTTFVKIDADGDGFSVAEGDCDDNNPNVHPGATEVCNGVDDDCDGQIDEGVKSTFYRDVDGDGYGNLTDATQACSAPAGYVANSTDCNDANAAIHPGATELCNGVDDNCDGQIDEGVKSTFYRDADGDGYGNLTDATQACSAPAGYVANSADCNDANAAIHPNATEVCNGVDDNCDGQIDEGVKSTFYRDADGDGYGNVASSIQACSAPAGYVANNTDCNDANAAIHPGAAEICGDGIDQDCNGVDTSCPVSLIVLSPNGGETWTLGSTQTIRWTSIGVSGNVKIELSRNRGTSWTTLFKGTANDGMQNWKVTKPATTKARIRVSSVKDPSTTDASDAHFTIQ